MRIPKRRGHPISTSVGLGSIRNQEMTPINLGTTGFSVLSITQTYFGFGACLVAV